MQESDFITGECKYPVSFEERFAQFGVNVKGGRWFTLDEFFENGPCEVTGNIFKSRPENPASKN